MPRSILTVRILVLVGIAVPTVPAADVANPELERTFTQTVRPFLTRYCIGCHGDWAKTGGLSLAGLGLTDIPAPGQTWE